MYGYICSHSKRALCFVVLIQLTEVVHLHVAPWWWEISASPFVSHALVIYHERRSMSILPLLINYLVFEMTVIVSERIQNGSFHSYQFEIINVVYNSQNWSVISDHRHWRSQTLTPTFFTFWRWGDCLLFYRLLKGWKCLIYLKSVLSQSIVGIFPYSTLISREIILFPYEISNMHCVFLVLIGNLLPFSQVIFKLLPNEVCIVSTENAVFQFCRTFMFLDYLIHEKS